MFRDDRQIRDAIRVPLRSLRLQHLWTETGPTDRALELLADRGGPLSHGEALVLLPERRSSTGCTREVART